MATRKKAMGILGRSLELSDRLHRKAHGLASGEAPMISGPSGTQLTAGESEDNTPRLGEPGPAATTTTATEAAAAATSAKASNASYSPNPSLNLAPQYYEQQGRGEHHGEHNDQQHAENEGHHDQQEHSGLSQAGSPDTEAHGDEVVVDASMDSGNEDNMDDAADGTGGEEEEDDDVVGVEASPASSPGQGEGEGEGERDEGEGGADTAESAGSSDAHVQQPPEVDGDAEEGEDGKLTLSTAPATPTSPRTVPRSSAGVVVVSGKMSGLAALAAEYADADSDDE